MMLHSGIKMLFNVINFMYNEKMLLLIQFVLRFPYISAFERRIKLTFIQLTVQNMYELSKIAY